VCAADDPSLPPQPALLIRLPRLPRCARIPAALQAGVQHTDRPGDPPPALASFLLFLALTGGRMAHRRLYTPQTVR
jgi:hypothetical protein